MSRRWSSIPSGKCSYERPTRGTICGTMRSMCGADAGCLAINYQSLTSYLMSVSVRLMQGLLQPPPPSNNIFKRGVADCKAILRSTVEHIWQVSPRSSSPLSSNDTSQETSARYRAVEPEQWLQRHPEAGSSWPSWPRGPHIRGMPTRDSHFALQTSGVVEAQVFVEAMQRRQRGQWSQSRSRRGRCPEPRRRVTRSVHNIAQLRGGVR